jgi:hypothetical protein
MLKSQLANPNETDGVSLKRLFAVAAPCAILGAAQLLAGKMRSIVTGTERKRRVKAAAMRHFQKTHPDYMREYMQARRAADPEEHREQAHEYYIENRKRILAAARAKRAAKRAAASGATETAE